MKRRILKEDELKKAAVLAAQAAGKNTTGHERIWFFCGYVEGYRAAKRDVRASAGAEAGLESNDASATGGKPAAPTKGKP